MSLCSMLTGSVPHGRRLFYSAFAPREGGRESGGRGRRRAIERKRWKGEKEAREGIDGRAEDGQKREQPRTEKEEVMQEREKVFSRSPSFLSRALSVQQLPLPSVQSPMPHYHLASSSSSSTSPFMQRRNGTKEKGGTRKVETGGREKKSSGWRRRGDPVNISEGRSQRTQSLQEDKMRPFPQPVGRTKRIDGLIPQAFHGRTNPSLPPSPPPFLQPVPPSSGLPLSAAQRPPSLSYGPGTDDDDAASILLLSPCSFTRSPFLLLPPPPLRSVGPFPRME